MRSLNAMLLCASVMFCACSGEREEGRSTRGSTQESEGQQTETLDVIIETEEEHFGHDTSEENMHTTWIDGTTGRIVGTGEPFVIYWVNTSRAQTSFSFRKGKTYSLRFRGPIQDGVMAYQGKCIDITQLLRAQEQPTSTSNDTVKPSGESGGS